jgi:hypothetical protein
MVMIAAQRDVVDFDASARGGASAQGRVLRDAVAGRGPQRDGGSDVMQDSRGFRLFYVLTFPLIFPIAAVGYLIMWIWYGDELKKPPPEREYNRRRNG